MKARLAEHYRHAHWGAISLAGLVGVGLYNILLLAERSSTGSIAARRKDATSGTQHLSIGQCARGSLERTGDDRAAYPVVPDARLSAD